MSTQDSVNALYTKCLQCLLRDSRLVSRTWKHKVSCINIFGQFSDQLLSVLLYFFCADWGVCCFFFVQKLLAKEELQMNLLKQAVEVKVDL